MKAFVVFIGFLLASPLSAQTDTSKVYQLNGRQVRYLKVEKGKTLYSISKTYNVPQDTLMVWNKELEHGLKTGMILRIPVLLPAKPEGKDKQTEAKKQGKAEEKSVVKKAEEPKRIPLAEEVYSCTALSADSQKRELNVVLFLPFYISREDGLNPKSQIGLGFYSGAKLALDSLAKAGINAKVHVFDARSDSAVLSASLKSPACKNADLIIGPLYSSGFKPVAEFARKNKIAAISPFVQSDAILQAFDNVVKLTPDQNTLLGELCIKMVERNPNARFTLLRNANEKDKALANHIASVLKGKTTKLNYRELLYTTAQNLSDSLDESKDNIVFFPSTVQVQVIGMVSKLGATPLNKRIRLVGLQEWNNFENIDYDHLNALNFTYASNYFPEFAQTSMVKFRSEYKAEYKTEPGSYAIQGYDVLLYFTQMAARYGKDFYHCIEKFPMACGLGSCYEFVRAERKAGLENHAIYVVELKDFIATPLR
ncbi:MAG: ABC transporter substrate-binding protein [Bacteroidia bacterium]|nr:ABC transporter substrate-binding protein [Bacteroidia bacterium]